MSACETDSNATNDKFIVEEVLQAPPDAVLKHAALNNPEESEADRARAEAFILEMEKRLRSQDGYLGGTENEDFQKEMDKMASLLIESGTYGDGSESKTPASVRVGGGVHKDEEAAAKRRAEFAKTSLEKLLGEKVEHAPSISLCFSGGGYRFAEDIIYICIHAIYIRNCVLILYLCLYK